MNAMTHQSARLVYKSEDRNRVPVYFPKTLQRAATGMVHAGFSAFLGWAILFAGSDPCVSTPAEQSVLITILALWLIYWFIEGVSPDQ